MNEFLSVIVRFINSIADELVFIISFGKILPNAFEGLDVPKADPELMKKHSHPRYMMMLNQNVSNPVSLFLGRELDGLSDLQISELVKEKMISLWGVESGVYAFNNGTLPENDTVAQRAKEDPFWN